MACHCQCDSSSQHDERYQKLNQVIANYRGKPGALIPVLHQAQQIFGYLPKDVQIMIADGLNLPLSEVYGVLTFYSLFTTKPRGKYTIGVCMGTACYVKGAAQILQELQKQLDVEVGGTTRDGLFSLTVTRCLGACGLAPVLTIGDDVYGRLTVEKIEGILDNYRPGEEH
ncbi:MAG TPA: NADH-quinone oxidoreductase subunit NuoE [Bacillota bacterium]|nr:NADH-quinone oxidoreductase subunit NuoE [Bacillota bacterium]HPT86904.1 NADH-quinone oxidoreductase subunit NuoE [Bacillota bacterium]